jgi:hypothetical protein
MGVSVWTFLRSKSGEIFLPAPGAAAPAQPLDARIGENLRVLGYDVAPQSIQRSESAVLVTHFELHGRPLGPYTVYVGLFKGTARAPVTPASASDGRDRLRLATNVVQ